MFDELFKMFLPLRFMSMFFPSYGSFVLFISGMRIYRESRRAQEIRRRRAQMNRTPAPSIRRPFDDFHDQTWLPLCDNVSALASKKFLRSLTHDERRRIWKARSELALEVLGLELQQSQQPGEAIALLLQLPSGLDRPDPTCWCEAP